MVFRVNMRFSLCPVAGQELDCGPILIAWSVYRQAPPVKAGDSGDSRHLWSIIRFIHMMGGPNGLAPML